MIWLFDKVLRVEQGRPYRPYTLVAFDAPMTEGEGTERRWQPTHWYASDPTSRETKSKLYARARMKRKASKVVRRKRSANLIR